MVVAAVGQRRQRRRWRWRRRRRRRQRQAIYSSWRTLRRHLTPWNSFLARFSAVTSSVELSRRFFHPGHLLCLPCGPMARAAVPSAHALFYVYVQFVEIHCSDPVGG